MLPYLQYKQIGAVFLFISELCEKMLSNFKFENSNFEF